jgi:Rrf2 family transcriptional regulator, cysteine metabolism repressor
MSLFSFSKKTDYAIVFLEEIASRDGPVSITDIANKNHLPQKFMEKVAHELKKGGIIQSSEGRNGGYKLTKSPSDIKLIDILEVMEGKMAHMSCMKNESVCDLEAVCKARPFWTQLGGEMRGILENKTLNDLI